MTTDRKRSEYTEGGDASGNRLWLIVLEYDHLFMGSNSVTFPPLAMAITRSDSMRQNVNMAMVPINYRFGGAIGSAPRKDG